VLIEAGSFNCPAQTPMLLQLNVHPPRDADLLTVDGIASDPALPMRSYLDLFGNRVTRVEFGGRRTLMRVFSAGVTVAALVALSGCAKGDRGEKGDRGPPGAQGSRGPPGPAGSSRPTWRAGNRPELQDRRGSRAR
jgi:hypothetical protein